MTNNLLNKTVKLTVLSPLFIGAGKEAVLSPYTDFVQDGKQLVYLDERKLHAVLHERPELIEIFVAGIRDTIDNNRSGFSLSKFLDNHIGQPLDQFEKRRIDIDGVIDKKPVRSFIATAGRPFIPGSTIKGVFRTAAILYWLQNRRGGELELEKIKNLVAKRYRWDLRGFPIDLHCIEALSPNAFRYLRVSDSDGVSPSVLCVSEVERFSTVTISDDSLPEKHSSIPQWSETMPPGTSTTFSIALLKSQDITGFKFIETQSVQELFSIVNAFSKDACLHELKVFDNHAHNFDGFKDFYRDLECRIASLNSKEAIIRIGGGKTWFDNSIGLAIDNIESDVKPLLGSYLKLLKLGNLPFPSTRSAVLKNGLPALPLGWVKLSLEG